MITAHACIRLASSALHQTQNWNLPFKQLNSFPKYSTDHYCDTDDKVTALPTVWNLQEIFSQLAIFFIYLHSLQIAIVITDGEQTTAKEYTPLDVASKRIKDKGVEVFSLGIGSNVNTDQLRQIASSNDNVFSSAGFDELVEVVKPVVEKSCPSKGLLNE